MLVEIDIYQQAVLIANPHLNIWARNQIFLNSLTWGANSASLVAMRHKERSAKVPYSAATSTQQGNPNRMSCWTDAEAR